MSEYNITEIASIISTASGIEVDPAKVELVEKAEFNGGRFFDCLDIFSYTVTNDDGTRTVYLYSPEYPQKGVQKATLQKHEFVYQDGWRTFVCGVGRRALTWVS